MVIACFSLVSISILADLAGQSGNLRDVFDLLNQWVTGKMRVGGLTDFVLRFSAMSVERALVRLRPSDETFIDTERLVTRKSRTAC
jgi:hypothetical protein